MQFITQVSRTFLLVYSNNDDDTCRLKNKTLEF